MTRTDIAAAIMRGMSYAASKAIGRIVHDYSFEVFREEMISDATCHYLVALTGKNIVRHDAYEYEKHDLFTLDRLGKFQAAFEAAMKGESFTVMSISVVNYRNVYGHTGFGFTVVVDQ